MSVLEHVQRMARSVQLNALGRASNGGIGGAVAQIGPIGFAAWPAVAQQVGGVAVVVLARFIRFYTGRCNASRIPRLNPSVFSYFETEWVEAESRFWKATQI
ncbi:hypothetical protein VDG39_03915 [Xanthomonas campestris pv. raphani]|uniref:hypothetical protein n=2 Tax=Xanthomonas campestris TaxID=339 RepID=UPI002368AD5D|nr:hypothetical protein [Xanthomonas campestris]MEA9729642.1 hypothetical protein [Xanthomonas campestris]MEA9911895.1 hypothetical protein [Xanthomonas campestris pv. raphani]